VIAQLLPISGRAELHGGDYGGRGASLRDLRRIAASRYRPRALRENVIAIGALRCRHYLLDGRGSRNRTPETNDRFLSNDSSNKTANEKGDARSAKTSLSKTASCRGAKMPRRNSMASRQTEMKLMEMGFQRSPTWEISNPRIAAKNHRVLVPKHTACAASRGTRMMIAGIAVIK